MCNCGNTSGAQGTELQLKVLAFLESIEGKVYIYFTGLNREELCPWQTINVRDENNGDSQRQ